MKLLFASPTYGPVDPAALRSQRLAIMHASANGHTWLGDTSPDRMKFDTAREAVAQAALMDADAKGADAVFWADSDMILPTGAITRLAEHLDRGLHFVTGIYFQRIAPHWPLIAMFDDKRKCFQWLLRWPEKTVAPIDGCGFGCCITSVEALAAVGENAFAYDKYSEDFNFCLKAAAAGYQPHVDTGILCGHLADPVPVTYETFRETHPELFKDKDDEEAEASNGAGSQEEA